MKAICCMIDCDGRISEDERCAIKQALRAGENYGYGNIIAWLQTQWAVRLCYEGLNERSAVAAVRNHGPYTLPPLGINSKVPT